MRKIGILGLFSFILGILGISGLLTGPPPPELEQVYGLSALVIAFFLSSGTAIFLPLYEHLKRRKIT